MEKIGFYWRKEQRVAGTGIKYRRRRERRQKSTDGDLNSTTTTFCRDGNMQGKVNFNEKGGGNKRTAKKVGDEGGKRLASRLSA